MEGFPEVSVPSEASAFQVLPRSRKKAALVDERKSKRRSGRNDADSEALQHMSEKANGGKDEKQKVRPGSYQAMGLSSEICRAMSSAGYGFPTPIQRKVIPCVLSGKDVVAMARTGSGKTAAFLAPLLHRLAESPLRMSTASRQNGPRALVVAPTRELVLQTLKFCRLYSKFMQPPIRSAVVVGGTPLESQFEALAVCPDIIFATPGRLLQILAEMGAKGGLTLSTAETVIFDEADRLFEGTLAVETAALIANLRSRQTETIENRQTILVSATMPHALAEFSRSGLRKTLSVIRLDADKGLSPTLATSFLSTRGDNEKDASLQILVRRILEKSQTAVVFAGTHRRVEYLTLLISKSITTDVSCIHGNMDQLARVEAVGKFRKKVTKVLVVTDVAARGIDLPDLDVVINYDMPATPKLFIHRIGRVGRAGRFGLAFSLVTADEVPFLLDVFLFVGRGIVFAEPSDSSENQDPFSSHAFAIESSFVVGCLPKRLIDEEVEVTRHVLEYIEVEKAYNSARNAHGLYTKTRGVASGESVRRGKELFSKPDGGRRAVNVHPWFASMESNIERRAAEEAYRLSAWRPKECTVQAPSSLVNKKRRYAEARLEEASEEAPDAFLPTSDSAVPATAAPNFLESLTNISAEPLGGMGTTKLSARQLAMDEERKRFFLPAHQDSSKKQKETALKVKSGGSMGDGLKAFRELQDAAMDLNADSNADLLRSKHTGSSSAKYWDRVSKKFVKGGVTSATSKKNLHVATREAKAHARAGQSYGEGDGVMFKKWLSKNRKAVEQLAERVDDGDKSNLSHLGLNSGLGSKDFRKGAFGRRARIAAAARDRDAVRTEGTRARSELKTTEEIKKIRKMKAKAEARRLKSGKKKGGGQRKQQAGKNGASHSGSAKSRMIVRKK